MIKVLEKFQIFLEGLDDYRDKLLFILIKPLWPRKITPNHLTYLRIAIGFILFVLLFYYKIENKTLILYIFFLGVITDLFDGSVSRCLNKETEFGAMLDPVADRILILPIAIYGLMENHKWLLLIYLLMELIGGLVSMYQKTRESDVKANIFGKVKMVIVSAVFFAILVYWPNDPPILFINILWISLIFSILSIFARMVELNNKGYIKNKFINKIINKYGKN